MSHTKGGNMIVQSYVWWILFGIVTLLLFHEVRNSIRRFVPRRMRPTKPRQSDVVQEPAIVRMPFPVPVTPTVAPAEIVTPAPLSWWERRRIRRKAREEEIKKRGEGALLVEVETWRYIQVLFMWLVGYIVIVVVVYLWASGFLEFLGIHTRPWIVLSAKEWMLHTLQIPIPGLLIIVGIIIGYGVRDETSSLFFMVMLVVTVVVGIWLVQSQEFNIFLIPSGKAFGSASIPKVSMPLGVFAPLFVAAIWFFILKQKPDAVL